MVVGKGLSFCFKKSRHFPPPVLTGSGSKGRTNVLSANGSPSALYSFHLYGITNEKACQSCEADRC